MNLVNGAITLQTVMCVQPEWIYECDYCCIEQSKTAQRTNFKE